MVKRFLASGRTGFCLSVSREGQVGAGDEIELNAHEGNGVSVPEITRLYVTKRYSPADVQILQRAARMEALPEASRSYLLGRLEKSGP